MITTHVLDTSLGKAAVAMAVVLEVHRGADWVRLSAGRTDAKGRLTLLEDAAPTGPALYRITFDTGEYHRRLDIRPFFPEVQVLFSTRDTNEHLHIPLLLSPFGYSTYRGT